MKLILRRDQKSSGMLSKTITFLLDVRADLSEEERANIKKYKLSDTILYERTTVIHPGSGLLGVASRLAHKATNLSISVGDLENGKRIDCKDIVEMIAIEEQVREAAQTFKNVLEAAAHFGGEEVIEIS
ncbi:hypothetical protein [Reyranella sp.]|uniref:hypothetical protein n=1 Tax=Reyranella sp. TaxID=1929291 RepID=UPI00271656B6|nr:hypothetical protein [Reyranella sp.]MDO8973950.1 hypothetical protein [Reyranella sp.]